MDLWRRLALAAVLAALGTAGCSSGSKYDVRTYRLGERVQLGNLIYNVYDSQWMTQLGDAPTPRIPDQRYFLVRVSVTNAGPSDVMVPVMSVSDENGANYTELSTGDNVPQWIGLLRRVKPAESLQGNIVFDCPPRSYKLRVSDETENKTALVEIPLTFGSETPELPAPAIPEKK